MSEAQEQRETHLTGRGSHMRAPYYSQAKKKQAGVACFLYNRIELSDSYNILSLRPFLTLSYSKLNLLAFS